MKYYWCVNCGYKGNFAFYRERNVKCEICEYDDLGEMDEDEYKEWAEKSKKLQDEDIFYITKGKQKSKL